jgi:hypothetical protein
MVVVLANPNPAPVTEQVMIANSSLMDDTPVVDLLGSPEQSPVGRIQGGFLTVTLPPETIQALVPREPSAGGYSRYKRVR